MPEIAPTVWSIFASFGFIDDVHLRRVLDAYYRQTRMAATADQHLAVIVGWGSVVEGLLTRGLLRNVAETRPASTENRARQTPTSHRGLKSLAAHGVHP